MVGEVAVLPDDVSGLRAVLELKFLVQKRDALIAAPCFACQVSEGLRVVALERDEGSCGHGECFKIIEQVINLDLTFAHSVEVIGRNLATTFPQCLNQGRVIEGEDDVGDLGFLLRWLISANLTLFLRLSADLFDGPIIHCNPLVQVLLNFFLQVLLEGISWGDALLEGAARGAVHISLPPVVALGCVLAFDRELNGIVTGCDCGHVPFELLDLAAFKQELDADGVE